MSEVTEAHIAEYSAIRDEICTFHNVEGQVMSIAVAAISALIVIVLPVQDKVYTFGTDTPFLHVVPLPFVALGIIFAYTQVRIIQAATYLQRYLRPRLITLLGTGQAHSDIWQWETFRRTGAEYPVRSSATFLNSVRWIFFIAPSLLPLSAWNRELKDVGAVLIVLWDLALPVFLIILAVWTSVGLPKRVMS
jgi:hypothetical protein